MAQERKEIELKRRRKVANLLNMPLTFILGSSAIGAAYVPETFVPTLLVIAVVASIGLVGLTVWSARCTYCGAGLRLNEKSCSRCNHVFED